MTQFTPRTFQINDHVIGFYYGRGLTGFSGYEHITDNWVNKGAWDLGIANYVVYSGDSALVFDTSTSPECGLWLRNFLNRQLKIKHITIALSHWHLDHIAGLSAFRDCQIFALDSTAALIEQNREAIENGNLWGPPGIPTVMPTHTFSNDLDVKIGDITIQLRHYQIHSRDGLAMFILADQAMYPGDMLEDTLSYIVEPGDIPAHLSELSRLQQSASDRIFPSHGSLARLADGGYNSSLIAAAIEYNQNMLRQAQCANFTDMTIEDMLPQALKTGAIAIWENYRSVHRENLSRVYEYWYNRKIP
ncbi:MAG: hypothetical protein GQF41_4606 [Candidatus Rifleibacterium amylolyticum]|nr:MAG: hypothetical protein GQF41_4606 [Candidatus Rifleibacterium amylolyticum]NLF95440.1 MBL fold metallo-hydrolase [Candidatus Riflebacteria bacterium]